MAFQQLRRLCFSSTAALAAFVFGSDQAAGQAGDITPCSAAILAAARLGDRDQLRLSLELGESPLCRGDRERTPLHLAAQNGQVEISLMLLAAGAIMSIDEMGRAPLHLAAQAGHLKEVDLLLEARGYFELPDATWRTPLHHAARSGHTPVLRRLLDVGAMIDAADGELRTALHYTSISDDLFNSTLLLIGRGSDIEREDTVGFRPLHFACNFNQPETAMHLMNLGADMYAMDKAGWNALVHAAANGFAPLVESLVVNANKPRLYAQPDPNMFVKQDSSATILGMPGIVFVIILLFTVGMAIGIPGYFFVKRFARLSKEYVVENADEEADELIFETFSYLRQAKEEMIKVCEEWDRVNVAAINDLHRVKAK